MVMKNVSLVEQEPENNTDNFGCSLLEVTVLNWMMKFYERWEANHKFI